MLHQPLRTYIHKLTLSLLFPLFLFASALFSLCLVTVPAHADDKREKAHLQFANSPAFFIENHGQTDKKVKYYFQGKDNVYFTDEGVMFQKVVKSQENPPQSPFDKGGIKGGLTHDSRLTTQDSLAYKLEFIGAKPTTPQARKELKGKINYLIGNDRSKWHSNIPTYQEIVYPQQYEGIDMVYKGVPGGMKYEFVVQPGANPDDIKLAYNGIEGLSIDDAGNLVIHTSLGDVKDTKLYCYQEIDGKQVEVGCSFVILDNGNLEQSYHVAVDTPPQPLLLEGRTGLLPLFQEWREFLFPLYQEGIKWCVVNPLQSMSQRSVSDEANSSSQFVYGFQVSSYNKDYPLVIDPGLEYSTFLGGDLADWGNGMTIDGSGNVYVTGWTRSADFPTTTGAFDTTYNEGGDAFITKLNPAGSGAADLIYSTFIGGGGGDWGWDVALDASGNAYLTGFTDSDDFPTTPGAFDVVPGGSDAFVCKLDSSGSVLVYSTYLGGGSKEEGHGIAVDGSGNAFVVGETKSTDFLTTPGAFDTDYNGGLSGGIGDVFVSILNPAGSGLLYSTFLGGSSDEEGRRIALDSSGNIYVTGWTLSSDFPTTSGAFDTSHNGGTTYGDAFVAKLSPAGSGPSDLVYSTFLGDIDDEYGFDVAVDSSGSAYVTGWTQSPDFPITPGAYGIVYNGQRDVYVTKLDPTGSSLVYSTFLGGGLSEWGWGIAVDSSGNAYVTGWTESTEFPTTPGAIDTSLDWADAFVAQLNPSGSNLLYSTLIGGGSWDECKGIAVDTSGNVYVAGFIRSNDFPTTSGAFDTSYNGGDDAFVAKLLPVVTPTEDCGNGIDDDGDGLVDCDDRDDCATNPACQADIADLEVEALGPFRVSPGQTVNYVVEYVNLGKEPAEDVVIVSELPSLADYISSTGGGIYRWERHEVFWKLGTVQPLQTGVLSFKVYFPWGLTGVIQSTLAMYGTSSQEKDYFENPDREPLFDLQDYLDYQPLVITSRKELTQEEFDAELASDARFKDLHQYAIELGFSYLVSTKLTIQGGSTLIQALMANPSENWVFLTKVGGTSFLRKFTEASASYFDRDGGMSWNLDDGTLDSWGEWAKSASPSRAKCTLVCVAKKVPKWVARKVIDAVDAILKGINCVQCSLTRDAGSCAKCANIVTKIPLVGEGIDTAQCIEVCMKDPSTHDCEDGQVKKDCDKLTFFGVLPEAVVTWRCKDGVWVVEDRIECKGDPQVPDPCNPKVQRKKICKCTGETCECVWEESLCGSSSFCSSHDSGICPAHDPNAKYGPEGAVSAGQKLDYKVEYENEGEGIAFGVYFTDVLDEDLDDSTLLIGPVKSTEDDSEIAPAGTYNASTRTIRWEVGEVGPQKGGYAELSCNVRADAPKGTEIINYATVYFPSVPEVTPTNAVVSVIPLEDCGNSIDDDGDGLVDCADPECDGICPEADNCADGRDNDSDGLTDCLDPDCPPCPEDCTNGLDDDADGLADCADADCCGSPDCLSATNYSRGRSSIKFNPKKMQKDKASLKVCVDQAFCEALMAVPAEVVLKLGNYGQITIPGDRLKPNKSKTAFSAKSDKGESPSYSLKINCKKKKKKGLLWLRLGSIDLKGQIFNPVRFCVGTTGGPCLCAEHSFVERRDRKGNLIGLSLRVTGACLP